MTNKEVWNQYKEYSQTTSEISRKFAFAGIAICWLFRDHNNDFPTLVMIAIILLLLKRWIRKEEIKMWESTGELDGNYNKPTWIDIPAFSFFIIKLLSLIISFFLLGIWLF